MPRPILPEHPERRPVVITGASSGIGAATALMLSERGFPVALGARRVEKLDTLAAALPGEVFTHALDLADPESVGAFAQAVTDNLGEVEVLISNAGNLIPGTVHEADSDVFASGIDLNILGPQRLVRAFVPGMVERCRGDLVFVSSDVANRIRPFLTSYAAGKWGLEGMVAAMQLELEGTGVRASIVRPGPTKTEMGTDWDGPSAERVINEWIKHGLARHGALLRAEAIAGAITSIVTAPRGTHLNVIEVSPEVPVENS
ncbi:MAG: SDR family oxidoreductase [Nocardioides sp.]|jgi:NADP-dependent 3-hydroxy acid dehydrogenase YdfG